MIDHRRCNKYVRQRVCDNPDLIRYSPYSHLVREVNRLAYLPDGFTISAINWCLKCGTAICSLRYVCCDETCSV